MNRLSIAAAVAVIVLGLACGAAMLTSSAPTPTRTPTATATSTTPAGSPSPSFVGYEPAHVDLAPEAMLGTWVANGESGLLRLVVDWTTISILQDDTVTFAAGIVDVSSAGFLTIEAASVLGGCKPGDTGTYRFEFEGLGRTIQAGTLLELSRPTDSCSARSALLARTWVPAIDVEHVRGGRGLAVAATFSPMFMISLPARDYRASMLARDVLMHESTDGLGFAFVAVRNPWGYAEPCSDSGGAKVPIDPTVDAFVAYIDGLPGFAVERSAAEINGHAAVHLTVPTKKTDACQDGGPTNGHVMEFTSHDPSFERGWFLNQGDTDSMYLVELQGNLWLFQWLGDGVGTDAERAVIETIRLIDSLPEEGCHVSPFGEGPHCEE